jgi:hypothetical protein
MLSSCIMVARDTSAKAAAIQDRLHDALGPEGRFRLAMKMSDLAREFAKAGVRDRSPGLADDQVARELATIFYGVRGQ